MGQYNMLKGNC